MTDSGVHLRPLPPSVPTVQGGSHGARGCQSTTAPVQADDLLDGNWILLRTTSSPWIAAQEVGEKLARGGGCRQGRRGAAVRRRAAMTSFKVWIRRYGQAYAVLFFVHGQLRRERVKEWGVKTMGMIG
ncbi:uncharacterized protein LOC124680382 [Lolium rigidum]|uniref:uncharacterized protein LOC124680382 n=1 Tax=Lolium rigidum TaxID=89674 RepID=UPI001F5C8924|nr:uncharacterized protein LOC124680382 [Lolium rigidum]